MKDMQTLNDIKANKRITDLEETVKEGLNININMAEEENKRTLAILRREIPEKFNQVTNKNQNNFTPGYIQEMDRKFEQMRQELLTQVEPKILGNMESLI